MSALITRRKHALLAKRLECKEYTTLTIIRSQEEYIYLQLTSTDLTLGEET